MQKTQQEHSVQTEVSPGPSAAGEGQGQLEYGEQEKEERRGEEDIGLGG